ncbi:MAG: CoB--CoM heterodisulfide reductase iron-sulfur subunit B family protein [Desulfobacteraceae bacterium]|jgi:heterodisulfide reductase subunit B
MEYLYYPGCSLEGSALEYNQSTRAVLACAGIDLTELEDWTCCGATAADAVSRLLSVVLPARNLALAEKRHPGMDILVPCSACYLNLKKVEVKIRSDAHLLEEINAVLAQEELTLTGTTTVKHLLEVLANDVGPETLETKVIQPLEGFSVAPYYGCQCLRPYAVFDDPEEPRAMEGLLRAAGAEVFDWNMGPKCCGASHMNTKMEVGLVLSGAILAAAQGADAIATVCPMCQLNLEGYQKKISSLTSAALPISVLYLPQLLGLAMGLSEEDLKIDLNLAVTDGFRQKIGRREKEQQAAV